MKTVLTAAVLLALTSCGLTPNRPPPPECPAPTVLTPPTNNLQPTHTPGEPADLTVATWTEWTNALRAAIEVCNGDKAATRAWIEERTSGDAR